MIYPPFSIRWLREEKNLVEICSQQAPNNSKELSRRTTEEFSHWKKWADETGITLLSARHFLFEFFSFYYESGTTEIGTTTKSFRIGVEKDSVIYIGDRHVLRDHDGKAIEGSFDDYWFAPSFSRCSWLGAEAILSEKNSHYFHEFMKEQPRYAESLRNCLCKLAKESTEGKTHFFEQYSETIAEKYKENNICKDWLPKK